MVFVHTRGIHVVVVYTWWCLHVVVVYTWYTRGGCERLATVSSENEWNGKHGGVHNRGWGGCRLRARGRSLPSSKGHTSARSSGSMPASATCFSSCPAPESSFAVHLVLRRLFKGGFTEGGGSDVRNGAVRGRDERW